MTWTPKVGLVLKHKTIHQKVEILSKFEIPGMIFWEVDELGGYSTTKDRPWKILEACLFDQYEPVEERARE